MVLKRHNNGRWPFQWCRQTVQVQALRSLEWSCENCVNLLSKLSFPYTYGEKKSPGNKYIRAYLPCESYFWFIIKGIYIPSGYFLKMLLSSSVLRTSTPVPLFTYWWELTMAKNAPVLWFTTTYRPGLTHSLKEMNVKSLSSPLQFPGKPGEILLTDSVDIKPLPFLTAHLNFSIFF